VDAFAATRLLAGTGFLVVAAVSDFRTRRVRDPLWIALGSLGLFLLAVELFVQEATWPVWSLIGSAAILFYAVFFGRPLLDEDGFHARPVRVLLLLAAAGLLLLPLATETGTKRVPELASMPIMILVYQGMYRLRILHGGADAKALMALTLLVPSYPDLLPFPFLQLDPLVGNVMRVLFPFSLVIWVDAAIVSLAVPLALFLFNVLRGDIGWPQSFLGYRVPVDSFPAHAWLMEKITDRGDHVLVLFPKRGKDPAHDLERLRAAGIRRVWATPQTPFMVPLLAGFFLAFLAGNLLIAVFALA
jgi:archaeal preflagellin peptidase FlaK